MVAVNLTNTTMQATPAAKIADLTLSRLVELIRAPVDHSELLWIVIPLAATLVLMELYFGRYKEEELGWNTAVGNSMILIFVAMDLFRHLWEHTIDPNILNILLTHTTKTILILFLALGSLWLLIADFFHFLPKSIAFMLSSSIPIKVIAYVTIVLVYTNIPFDWGTLAASVALFAILFVIFKLIQFFIPISIRER
ncbi:hypothetical protein GF336_07640 [Candidatus Woesearchaeota archaeon]|nr:hypothetical protein [Candidatus Woesearchaeota archaeon]